MDKKDYPKNWRNILWREWRNTDDEEYARHLFELVTHKSAMDGHISLLNIGLGSLYGAGLGFLIALIATLRTVLGLSVRMSDPINFVLLVIGGSFIGGLIGLLIRLNLKRSFIWPQLFLILQVSIGFGLIYWLIGGLETAIIVVAVVNIILSLANREDLFMSQVAVFFLGALILIAFFVPILGIAPGIIVACALYFLLSPTLFKLFFNKLAVRLNNRLYLQKTMPLIQQIFSRENRNWYFWWRRQPDLTEIELALDEVFAVEPQTKNFWKNGLQRLRRFRTQLKQPDLLVENLESSYWANRFGAMLALFELGGKAVHSLQTVIRDDNFSANQEAIRILKNIAWDTTNRLAEHTALICPQCLTRCHAHKIDLPWQPDLTYYGCRTCRQSREFLECPQGIVAVLDAGWAEAHRLRNGLLRVNWLAQQRLFDFDRVEIIQATDEDVERFAMQVGNDTDSARQPRYAQMPCLIAPDCRLSENSLRILRNFFGQVERLEIVQVETEIVEDTELAPAKNMADEETDVYWQDAD